MQFFFRPPPFQIQFSFVNLISLFLLIPPWNGAQNICSPNPPSYTPHLLPICYHMIFDGADRARGRGGRGGEKRGGLSRKRDEKCKNIEGVEKRKILRVPLRERRRETRGWRGGAYPPCPPSHIWKAGCNHFEKCVDPSTVIIIKKIKKKTRKHFMRTELEGETNLLFFLLT